MGLMDIIKGIGRLPGALNEARYEHGTMRVPANSQPLPQIPAGTNPDDLVTIGFDPDTGEPVQIPQSELGNYNLNVGSGQVMQDKKVRTGRKSGFGQFLSQGLPRMLDAGIAAATSRGDGTGGALAVLKGMDIGSDRLQKRDMLAYQQARQRMQDQSMMEDRAARAEENRMQAEMYRRRMDGSVGGGGATQRDPTTWEAELVQMHRSAIQSGDMEKANAVADKLDELRNGRKQASEQQEKVPYFQTFDQMLMWRWQHATDPAEKAQLEAQIKAKMAGQGGSARPPAAIKPEWVDGPNGTQQGVIIRPDQNGNPVVTKIHGATRTKPGKTGSGGGRKPAGGMTSTKADEIENDKAKDLAKAQKEFDDEIKDLPAQIDLSNADEKTKSKYASYDVRRAEAVRRLARAKAAAQSRYEQRIKAAGGSITETWNPDQQAPAAASTGGNPWDRWK